MHKNDWGKPLWQRKMQRMLGFIVFLLLAAVCLVALEAHLKPIVEVVAKQRANVEINRIINEAVAEEMSNGVNYDDLVEVHKNENGEITFLQSDSIKVSLIANSVARRVEKMLAAVGEEGIAIPSGLLSGFALLSDIGPKINVAFQPIGSAHVYADEQFRSEGINMSKHSIYLNVEVKVGLLLPFAKELMDVQNSLPLIETIIVGPVPQTYLNF